MSTTVRVACLAFAILSSPVAASEKAIEEAVKALGSLNGVALHCRYMDAVQQIKAAVIDNAPPTRHFGSVFEESTNESYLTAAHSDSPCPSRDLFDREVSESVKAIEKAAAGT